jgi:SAM-dependent methyltransferase
VAHGVVQLARLSTGILVLANVDPALATLRARLYSLTHRGTSGDVDFYVAQASGADSVLELGCGSGRILTALAQAAESAGGHTQIVGLDNDPDALRLAKTALGDDAATLVEADMRSFQLDRQFDRIFIPYNSLYALLTDEDMVACLTTAASHLTPSGRIVFDGYIVADGDELESESADTEREFEHLASIIDAGTRIHVFETERPSGRRYGYDAVYRYQLVYASGARDEVDITIQHHYIPASHLPSILAQSGLRALSVFGNFYGSPLGDESPIMVVESVVAC